MGGVVSLLPDKPSSGKTKKGCLWRAVSSQFISNLLFGCVFAKISIRINSGNFRHFDETLNRYKDVLLMQSF